MRRPGLAAIAPQAGGAVQASRQAPVASASGEHSGRRRPAPHRASTLAYIYSQFDHLVTHFQHREAGYRAGAAGHTGFARYWSSQMLRLLGPFGARAQTFRFPVRGWLGRPATAPAADVEITVPGLTQPAERS